MTLERVRATKNKATAHLVAPTYPIHLTIPAREALERAGNRVDCPPSAAGIPTVTLRRPPPGLVVVIVSVSEIAGYELAARMDIEPPYPGEHLAPWYDRGAWVPCPTCGAALLWCEAGYAPGWRICLGGHACQLSDHGALTATRHPEHDAATLASTRPPVLK